MENPGLKTLITFLSQVKRNAPANFTALSEERRKGYGMVSRYIRYCLGQDLIRVVSEQRTRGRYPSKRYALSEKGATFLELFKEKA
jgi:hypothetical protein